jgi:hypothetical protein
MTGNWGPAQNLRTPDALLGGLIFEKIYFFEAQEVKSAFELGFSG